MTVAEAVARARERLLAAGVPADQAPGDAEVLARHALGWDLTRYAVGRREAASPDFASAYEALIARRAAREPVSQIVGHREFWGLDFEVSRDVLTPRPETELLVQAVLDLYKPSSGKGDRPTIIDIGTGSGCIAVALAKELPDAHLIASDASLAALTIARRNAARHGVADRIAFLHSALIPPENDVEVVVSNPPYIPRRERDRLPPEVCDYEPAQALFGGEDGLDIYRAMFQNLPGDLVQGGYLVVEVGYDQAAAVAALADPSMWTLERTYRDLQGIERVMTFRVLRPGWWSEEEAGEDE
jgi:release factor glutamine methyltransferase